MQILTTTKQFVLHGVKYNNVSNADQQCFKQREFYDQW